MRFAYVNHRYWPFVGGSERWIQVVAEAMASEGHAVRVTTSDAFDLEYFWDHRRRAIAAAPCERAGGVEIERVPVRHLPAGRLVFHGTRRLMGEASRLGLPAGPFRSVARRQPFVPGLEESIQRGGTPDLIHATNLGLEGLAVAAQDVARERSIPFVVTPFIHLGVATDRIARRYVSMPHQRQLLQQADAVIAMTETEAAFIRSLGVNADRVYVAGAGVDLNETTGGNAERFRERYGISGFLVGTIGALAEDKGTMDVVRAVCALRRAGRDVELALVGPALGRFERWFASLSASERQGIHLLGFIPEDDKRDLLAAMDVLAVPSRTESFGIVYLEAWANRKPVLAADAGAIRDLIHDGDTGLIAPFGDVASICAHLARFQDDQALRLNMGERGYNQVLTHHTWSHVVERVRIAYKSVF